MKEYLAAHRPPDYSLVLDYVFPSSSASADCLDGIPGRSRAERSPPSG
jgi:hypothetical protein